MKKTANGHSFWWDLLQDSWASQVVLVVKNLPAKAGDKRWRCDLWLRKIPWRHGNPLQHSCLENPMDGGAWWAAVYGVAQSRTRLKRLSSSSRIDFQQTPHE